MSDERPRRTFAISVAPSEPDRAAGIGCADSCCSVDEALAPLVEAPTSPTEDTCADDCCAPVLTTASSSAVALSQPPVAPSVCGVSDGARSVLRVSGMDCASCAVTIEKRVAQVPGVHRATVNFAAGRLDVEHLDRLDQRLLEIAVEQAGYRVDRPGSVDAPAFWTQWRVRLTLAGTVLFALGAVMSLAGAPGWATRSAYLAATVIGGFPMYRAALASARVRSADVNLLMSLAVVGAGIIDAWGEAALVVILFSVSNALQVYAVGRTQSAVRALARLTPDEVLARRSDGDVVVPAAGVAVGDVVLVRPGERVAVDGTIIDGSSALDESPITGESIPVEKGAGDGVFSGSLNGPGGLVVQVTKAAGDSTLQRITRMVEEAQSSKAPIEQFVARFARVYTPVVLAAAAVVAIVPPLLGGDFSSWFYRALVLLIVSCPCALVISTPVSVVSGIGGASRDGILIKGGAALEAAGKLTTLFFDKTGTLTQGRPVVEQVIPVGDRDADELIRLAAALERRSEHPLAHAILTAAGDAELPEVRAFRSITGRGAEGEVDGRRLLIGSPRLFDELGIGLEVVTQALQSVDEAGETPVILGDNAGALAVFGLADSIRPDAKAALDELRALGVNRLMMLTGDADAPARRVAQQLGIEYRSGLVPEDKVAAVREAASWPGTTGMVGDGINDAPALAAADVSFAMGAAGTDAALEAADVALMADNLSKVAQAVRLSRRAERTIKQNIAVAIVLNTSFTVLAPIGLVPLWVAVLEDAISSTGVTANSLRLLKRERVANDRPSPRLHSSLLTSNN